MHSRFGRVKPARREEQGRIAGGGPGVDVGAVLDQGPDDFGVPLPGRPHQRRLAVVDLAGVHVGAGLDEAVDGVADAAARARHQRRLADRRTDNRQAVGPAGPDCRSPWMVPPPPPVRTMGRSSEPLDPAPSGDSPDASIGAPGVVVAPPADAVEVLEGEAQRVRPLVARGAGRALRYCPICKWMRLRRPPRSARAPARCAAGAAAAPRGCCRARTCADHRRHPRRVGRHRQDAGVAKQPGPPLVRHRHAPEVRPVDVANAVEPREPLLQVRVVRRQQLDERRFVAHLVFEEQLGLALERLPKVVVDLGVRAHVQIDGSEVPDERPPRTEVPDDRRRPRAREHAAQPSVQSLKYASQ